MRLKGYQTVESKSHLRAGGRGLAISVRKGLGMSISEILQTPHWMVASVSGIYSNSERMTAFVVNLHMPHHTSRRKLVIKDMTKYLRKLCARNKKAKILLIGDFNKDINSTVALLNRIGIGLRRAVVRNSKGSRLNGARIGRMIDHIAFSGFANNPNYAKVLKSVDLSDHLPVVAEWNIESLMSPVLTKRIDAAKINELGESFTSCSRFAVLADKDSNTENLVNSVTKSIYETAEELDALKTIASDYRTVLSKETLETIRKRRKVFKKLSKDPSVEVEYSGLKEKTIQLCRQDRMNNRKVEVKKACDLMICNKSRELWSWLKRFSGRFSSSLVDGPIFDKNRQLITDSEAKAEVWASHFEELAKDSTGNSRSAKKWRDIGKNYTAEFTECDTPLSWAEICAALKSTPNNKSPGSDGIPSEVWKMVQYEDEPTSPLAKLILRLITGIWDAEKIPKQLDPSVVIPIPKKGDIRDPNNYRGISLIPTLSKVLSKIIARRLCKIDNKYSILAKEQAGFRTREECVAQATTLYEVVRRRKISGLSTWIGFIDFAKAYDRVPHEALLRKIKTAGIGGKLYRVIEALYRSPKMCVRVGDRLSKTVDYNCGVRQGCPASPMLFDIYINDLLDGIKGVKIPGIEECIPGLLFADDAVVLAESPAELQIALEKLTAWSQKWEMQINQDKCGIMGINSSTGMLFTIMGKPITQVKEYKYLGVVFNNKWNNLSALQNNKENERKAFQSMYYFLSRKDVPTAMRAALIRTVLIPILCYGCEIFGMSAVRCSTLQKVADDATRLVAGVGRSTALSRLRSEMKIDDIFTRASVARERGHNKWTTSKTWITELINKPFKNRLDTWVSGTVRWKKRFLKGAGNNTTAQALRARKIRNDHSKITQWVIKNNLGLTSNWMGLELAYPEQARGIRLLAKVRMGAFMTAQSLANSRFISEDYKLKCPFCNVSEAETVEHMLLRCQKWNSQRSNCIGTFIGDNTANLNLQNSGVQPLLSRLLGGELNISTSMILRNRDTPSVKMVLGTASFLTDIFVARTLMLSELRGAPASLIQCLQGTEDLEVQRGIG
ncbi:putative RNA-directed DNA polymerase from transposon BS [Smittium culicis]|uniref:Putative RNA-directed DNA polymerase from transposon BS n=1 Tax=Smittium culicis TaxID=133412 RepID=A0A1R1Y7R2_9FUNG|nr:putative RNA-directed DNA polymerase from transposon BS [Smittium culicis]